MHAVDEEGLLTKDSMSLKVLCMMRDGMMQFYVMSMYTAEPLHNGRRHFPFILLIAARSQTHLTNRKDQMLCLPEQAVYAMSATSATECHELHQW